MPTADKQLETNQRRYKENFDKLVKERDVDLKPGDMVYLRRDTPHADDNDDLETKRRKLNEHKLRSKAIGPYKIEKVESHTVTINQDGFLNTVSRDRVVRAPTVPEATSDDDVDDDERLTKANDDEEEDTAPPDAVIHRPDEVLAPSTKTHDTELTASPPAHDEAKETQKSVQISSPTTGPLQASTQQPTKPNVRRSTRIRTKTTCQTDDNSSTKHPTDVPPRTPQSSTEQSSSDVDNTKEWAFERLIDYDSTSDKYLVRWSNYGPEHDSYQPPSDIPYNAVRRFHQRKKTTIPEYIPGRYLD